MGPRIWKQPFDEIKLGKEFRFYQCLTYYQKDLSIAGLEGSLYTQLTPVGNIMDFWKLLPDFKALWPGLGKQDKDSSVQFSCSVVSDSLWPHEPQHARPPYHHLPESTQTHVHRVNDAIQPSHPLSSTSPALSLSQHQGLFKWVSFLQMSQSFQMSQCIRWPKYWSFSFNISPSNEHPGLISFRMNWLDLLAVQRTIKSLLQHHSSKASILWHLAFFIVQLSHPYMTPGKTITLIRRTLVGKAMSLLFNMLSTLVIAFLPRSKHLQSPSAVILEPRKIKSATVSTVSPSVCHEVMELDAMILVYECWALSQLFTLLFHFHQEAF